ncbi:MAG: phosphoribosyltransferase family protein [Cyanobacteria bacterium P01_B01_bin.77]
MNQKQKLAKRVKDCCQLSGQFKLRSGKISDTYFDKYLFASDPILLNDICTVMVTIIPPETQVLAGLEMGGIPVVTMLSHITGKPATFICKQAKSYGTCKYAEGPDLTGKTITLIEDVVSSGGAILDALGKMEADAIRPIAIACVIDRQTGGFENLSAAGYELRSVLTINDIESIA